MVSGGFLTRPRVMAITALVCAVVAVTAAAGYWKLSRDCECSPSRYEKTSYLYKITHFQRFTTRYYGQFYEDYILGYVFAGQPAGFYIDVGANDPNKWNSTRYFYQRGWSGMNIEPNAVLFRKIMEFRPRDMNYNVGIANTEGTMTFYQAAGKADPLSTFDRDEAERLKREQGVAFAELPVPVTTLNALLEKKPVPAISFLSVDVEGFERQVLESIDLAKFRPAVLCIEATAPTSEVAVYGAWEPRVLKSGYLFAMSDGLNRYYVHKSRLDLLDRFIHVDMCVKRSKLGRQVKMDGFTSWSQ